MQISIKMHEVCKYEQLEKLCLNNLESLYVQRKQEKDFFNTLNTVYKAFIKHAW